MEGKELLEEIRMNRKEIQDVKKELYIFKGKAFGFLAGASIIVNILINYIQKFI